MNPFFDIGISIRVWVAFLGWDLRVTVFVSILLRGRVRTLYDLYCITFFLPYYFLTTSGGEVNKEGEEKLYEVRVLVKNW